MSAGAVAIPGFTLLDAGALAFFFLSWIAYGTLADRGRGSHSLHATVDVFRERWMREMVQRELRMLDALILANLVRGITFFASTAILPVAGDTRAPGRPAASRVVRDLHGSAPRLATTRGAPAQQHAQLLEARAGGLRPRVGEIIAPVEVQHGGR